MPTRWQLLKRTGLHVDAEEVSHAGRFRKLRRELDAQPTGFLTAAFVASSHLLELALNPVLTLASVWKHTPLDFADP